MKAQLPAIGCLVLASFLVSCSSGPRASSAHHASASNDDDLDGDDGAPPAGGGEDGDDDELDSGMLTAAPLGNGEGSAKPPQTPMGSSANLDTVNDYGAGIRTRYQVIQNGFDRANAMPTVNDFDPLDEPSPRLVCLSVKANSPSQVSEIVIKQMMVQIAGSADYGPLFPGSLDHVEARLVIGKNNGWVNSQNLSNEMRQVFELEKAPGSLVIRINENKFGIYQDIGAPAEVWIRKDTRGHLFFKVYRLDAQRNRSEVFIGYCYQRGGSPAVVR